MDKSMKKLFDDHRNYTQDDPAIVALLGDKTRQAQLRYHRRYPTFYRLGRRIVIKGADLNAWAATNRVETSALVES